MTSLTWTKPNTSFDKVWKGIPKCKMFICMMFKTLFVNFNNWGCNVQPNIQRQCISYKTINWILQGISSIDLTLYLIMASLSAWRDATAVSDKDFLSGLNIYERLMFCICSLSTFRKIGSNIIIHLKLFIDYPSINSWCKVYYSLLWYHFFSNPTISEYHFIIVNHIICLSNAFTTVINNYTFGFLYCYQAQMQKFWSSNSIKGCCDVVVVLAIELESDELNVLGWLQEIWC